MKFIRRLARNNPDRLLAGVLYVTACVEAALDAKVLGGCARPLKKGLPYQSLVNEIWQRDAKGEQGLI